MSEHDCECEWLVESGRCLRGTCTCEPDKHSIQCDGHLTGEYDDDCTCMPPARVENLRGLWD